MSEQTSATLPESGQSEVDRLLAELGGDPEAETPPAPAEETPPAQEEPKEETAEELKTRLHDLESKLAGQSAEISILRDFATRPTTAPAATEEEPEIDVVGLRKKLETAPVETILEIVNKATERTARKVREETLREFDGRTKARDLLQEDRDTVLREYPAIMTDSDFQAEASAEFSKIQRLRGGQTLPGDMYAAVSAAAAKRVGKVPVRTNGRRELVNPMTRSANPPAGDETRPEGEFKPHEMAAIEKTCKQYGISKEQYMARFAANRKKDRSFGRPA